MPRRWGRAIVGLVNAGAVAALASCLGDDPIAPAPPPESAEGGSITDAPASGDERADAAEQQTDASADACTVGFSGPLIAKVASVDSNGLVNWANAEGARVPGDTSLATGAWENPDASAISTRALVLRDFGAAVPPQATVTGITATIHRRADGPDGGAGGIRDREVFLDFDGASVSTDQASGAYWPHEVQAVAYGGSDDDWGTSIDGGLTPEIANSSLFGVRFRAYFERGGLNGRRVASVDAITLTVHFTCPK